MMAPTRIQSNTKYMSDMARVEHTVQKVANMTLEELNRISVHPGKLRPIEYIAIEMLSSEWPSLEESYTLPEEIAGTTFLEFLHAVNDAEGDPRYSWIGHDRPSERMQLYFYKFIALALINASHVSVPVKMFLAVPLRAYYTYLKHAATGLKNRIWREFSYIRNTCEYAEDYTIRDYISEKLDRLNMVWLPIVDLDDYKRNIEAAHRDIGRLLVNSMCIAFPMEACAAKSSFVLKDSIGKQADLPF